MAGSLTLTIPSAEQLSEIFLFAENTSRQAVVVAIIAPADLAETVNIQIAGPLDHYAFLKSGGNRIQLSADDADQVIVVCAEKLRLRSTTAVAADRVFEMLWNLKPGV